MLRFKSKWCSLAFIIGEEDFILLVSVTGPGRVGGGRGPCKVEDRSNGKKNEVCSSQVDMSLLLLRAYKSVKVTFVAHAV